MQNAKHTATPITTGQKLSVHGSNPVMDIQLYRSMLGPFNMPQSHDLR